jgi:hypothetical protein
VELYLYALKGNARLLSSNRYAKESGGRQRRFISLAGMAVAGAGFMLTEKIESKLLGFV